ncbi:MAG: Uma2 family endonuclease [Blastocatellia bacterium]
MASKPKQRFTPEEYLTLEREAEYRSEYLDGEIFAMVGASEKHNLIVVNIVTRLNNQLRDRPCKVYSSDMRVDLRERGLYAYPDVIALCDKARFRDDEDDDMDNLLNPALIIEVLSKSTEAYDRGEKFTRYRRIGSLVEYLLVAQDKSHVEHYIRQSDNEWLLTEANSLDHSIYLPSIECHLKLADVYNKVEIGE